MVSQPATTPSKEPVKNMPVSTGYHDAHETPKAWPGVASEPSPLATRKTGSEEGRDGGKRAR